MLRTEQTQYFRTVSTTVASALGAGFRLLKIEKLEEKTFFKKNIAQRYMYGSLHKSVLLSGKVFRKINFF
jgi:hypothetical protein